MHSKEMLGEFIYKLNQNSGFLINRPFWSSPAIGFIHNNSLPSKFTTQLKKANLVDEGMDAVICILADWDSFAEGIIFTDRAVYVNSPKNNSNKRFKVRYDEITELSYLTDPPKLKIFTKGNCFTITTELWSKRNIYDYLQFACETYKFHEKYKDTISNMQLESAKNADVGSVAAGLVYGNISNASSFYFDDKLLTPRGHGFAAEHANHLFDKYQGKDAHILGDDNAKNGADRLVDGTYIQSKYCSSGSKCVQECFESGRFRYLNPDGTPMQIEVPSDKYESAIQAMENRIRRGEVPGITNPDEAKNIIRKGHFTYAQARNIAKAGTVESIVYDAASGAIIAKNAFGVTAALTFATAVWNGQDFKIAVKSAAAQGLKVGGMSFVTSVLAGQLSKAGLNSLLVNSSEAVVRLIGPKACAVLVNAFRSGTNIYGAAAMKSAAKMLRGNVITSAVSFVVLSVGDIANIFRGRISGGQLFKNLTNTGSAVVGGGVGWTGGAAAGAAIGSVVPGVGTAVGGIVGGIVGAFGGGSLASKASGAVLDQFIEDDADKMVLIIQTVFTELAEEYLVSQTEADRIVDQLQESLSGKRLKDMFASSNPNAFARNLMESLFENMASKREYISLPSTVEMQEGLRELLEDVAEEEGITNENTLTIHSNETDKPINGGDECQNEYSMQYNEVLSSQSSLTETKAPADSVSNSSKLNTCFCASYYLARKGSSGFRSRSGSAELTRDVAAGAPVKKGERLVCYKKNKTPTVISAPIDGIVYYGEVEIPIGNGAMSVYCCVYVSDLITSQEQFDQWFKENEQKYQTAQILSEQS